MQINALLFALFCGKRMVFSHEKLGSGQTEAINTLLDVADHKQVFYAFGNTGNCRKKRLLDVVAILVFIDHHFPEFFAILCSDLCRLLRFGIHQNPQCHVLQIREIDDVFGSLLGRKGIRKRLRQLHKHDDCPMGLLQKLQLHR